jgi:hypothetical protein
MSTKFDLESPYDSKWRYGYIVTNRENRKHVCLVGGEPRSTTSYARYLLSTALGRVLESWEQVDHIDHDKTNDVLENLQILTVRDNSRKEAKHKGKLVAEITCPSCANVFVKRTGITQAVNCYKGRVTCCSRTCRNEFAAKGCSRKERDQISLATLNGVYRVYG